jgi:ubiquinone/menaquinone biosynthesis C-methylase UbiE
MICSSTFKASDGSGYELIMGRWSRRLSEPFLDFSGFADGEQVLDVGCGTGSLTFALSARAKIKSICGLDFSPEYINYATHRNADPRIEFRVGDACALPFPDRSFDRVLSLLMLHFIPQADRAVAEMRRVARPRSTVAAAVWDIRGGYVANRILFDTAAMLDPIANERRARNYTRPMTRPGELATAWRKAGFENVREGTLTIRMEFTSFSDYWTPYVGREGPAAEYVGALSLDHQQRLRDAVERAYLDGEKDGTRSYAASAWVVRGIAPAR